VFSLQGWVTSRVGTRGNPTFAGVSYESIL
jgi:hypothetical protein